MRPGSGSRARRSMSTLRLCSCRQPHSVKLRQPALEMVPTRENAAHQTFFRSGTREAVAIRLTGGATDCGATHCDSTHLTSGAARHSLISFVVAISRHSPRSASGLRGLRFALVAQRARTRSTHFTGTVEQGRSQRETARDGWRQLVAMAASDRCRAAVRLQSLPH
jgi:hypothetical protein